MKGETFGNHFTTPTSPKANGNFSQSHGGLRILLNAAPRSSVRDSSPGPEDTSSYTQHPHQLTGYTSIGGR